MFYKGPFIFYVSTKGEEGGSQRRHGVLQQQGGQCQVGLREHNNPLIPSNLIILGGRTGNQFNDFASAPSAVSRFTNPQSTTASAFMPPTSKLNPNAPDFMRPSSTSQQDYRMRNQQQQQNLLNKNNFNMMSQQAPPPLPPTAGSNSFNRFNNRYEIMVFCYQNCSDLL